MTDAQAPYPGLRPFREDEHPFFFGRYEHTTALYRLLDRGRLLAILGGSGSGKSSLVRAGLLPLLEDEKRADGTPRWSMVTLRPGTHSIHQLAAALLETATSEGETLQRVISGLRRTSHGLANEVDRLLPADREVLILVDQFEELFRYADASGAKSISEHNATVARLAQDDDSRRFVEVLLTAAARSERRIRVIITMRSDFLGDCARYRGLAEAVSANQYLTPWLDRDQQIEAIVGPLLRHCRRLDPDVFELTGIEVKDWSDLIEPQLVQQLVNDAGDEPDQLPVLQHALLRCWKDAAGGRLTLKRYRELGGWGVILSNHADEVMARSGAGRADAAERIFRALIERDNEGRAIRRPRTIAQLVDETGEREADVRQVIKQFSASDCSFLAPPTPPDDLVDIGHEALIRQWHKIADPSTGWLQKESRDALTWQLLLFQAQGHEQNPKDVLTPAIIEERQPWFEQHNERWAERYGGQWPLVDKLVRTSIRARDNDRRRNWALVILAFFVVSSAGIFGFFYQQKQFQEAERERVKAVAISIGFQLELAGGAIRGSDMEALIALARADRGERLAFIDEMFQRPALAGRLARKPAVVTRALAGLDPAKRQEIIEHVFGSDSPALEDRNSLYARALLGIELEAMEAIKPVLDAMKVTTDRDRLEVLEVGFAALATKLTEAQALPVLDAMLRTGELRGFRDIKITETITKIATEINEAQALQAFKITLDAMKERTNLDYALLDSIHSLTFTKIARKLNEAQAQQAVELVLDAMKQTTDPERLESLAGGLAFASELSEAQAQQAVDLILDAMKETTDPDDLGKLGGEVLTELPVELTDVQARQAVKLILKAIKATTDLEAARKPAAGLALVRELTEVQALQAVDLILDAMQENMRPVVFVMLFSVLFELVDEFTEAQARQLLEPTVDAMQKTANPGVLAVLGRGLFILPIVELTEARARQAVDSVLDAMKATTDPEVLGYLGGNTLTALPVELTEAQARQAVELIIDAMKQTTDPDDLGKLAEGLAFASKLTETQAQQSVELIIDAMKETTNPDRLERLAEGLAFASKLTETQARQAVQLIIDAMKETTNPDDLGELAEGLLVALPIKLTEAQMRQAANSFLDAMKETTDPYDLGKLGRLLGYLPIKLTEAQARQAVQLIIDAMKETTNPDDLEELAEGLAFASELSEVQQAVELIIDAMKETTDPGAFSSLWLGLLSALPNKPTEGQARQVVKLIIDAMKETTDPAALRLLGSEALTVLPVELTETEVLQAVEPILAAMKETTDPDRLESLAEGLAFASKLTEAQALQVVKLILDAMKPTNPDDVKLTLYLDLVGAFTKIGGKLTEAQARQAGELIIDAMKETTDPERLEFLAKGLAAIGAKPTEAQKQQAVELFRKAVTTTKYFVAAEQQTRAAGPVLGAMRETTDPERLESLIEGVTIATKLTEAQTQEAVELVLAAMKVTTRSYGLGSLAEGLAFASKLTETQARQAVQLIIDAMLRTSELRDLIKLGESFITIATKLTEAQAQQAVEPVLDAMKLTPDPHHLEVLGVGLVALAIRVTNKTQAVRSLITTMKSPWNAGTKSERWLLGVLQAQIVNKDEELPASLWKIITLTEQRFGNEINLVD